MGDALTHHRGPKGRPLGCVVAIEAGNFNRAQAIIPDAGEVYLASLAWANQAADPLFAKPAAVAT